MESGFVLNSGGEHVCSEECLNNMDGYSHEQFLIDYAESEAGILTHVIGRSGSNIGNGKTHYFYKTERK